MNKTIIISPSGNLYGSEYVLLDFLQCTKNKYTVFVKTKGLFYNKLIRETKHLIKPFNSEKALYLKLILILFFQNKIKTIYVNEGGHIRYIKKLATIFKKRKFIIHIRIKEDTNKLRLGKLKKNITLISVSKYISSFLKPKYNPILIYDLYKISQKETVVKNNKVFNISIVGRITKTKKLDNIFPILDNLNPQNKINFNFWGSYNENEEWFKKFKNKLNNYPNFYFVFKGFNKNKEQIYTNTDLVIHLNTVESLGRIVFEAIDYNTPIATFDKGGTGELMQMLELDEFTIKKKNEWGRNFAEKIKKIIAEKKYTPKIMRAKIIIKTNFSPKNYTQRIEQLFQT